MRDEPWWAAPKTVCLNTLPNLPPGRRDRDVLAEECMKDPACDGFSTDGSLCGALDLTALTYHKTETFYSKTQLPPLDYLVPTIVSFLKVHVLLARA